MDDAIRGEASIGYSIEQDDDVVISNEVQSISKKLGKRVGKTEDLKLTLINKAKILIKTKPKQDIIEMCKKSFLEGMLESDNITGNEFSKWVELIMNNKRVIVNTLSFYVYTL